MATICLRCGAVAPHSPCTNCAQTTAQRGYDAAWQRLSAHVIAQEHGICHLCGQPGADTTDHLTPLRHGGTHDRANLRAAHRACNGRKSDHTPLHDNH